MKLKILDTGIKSPDSDNDMWEFSIVVTRDDGTQLDPSPRHRVSAIDLNRWFKETVGRYPKDPDFPKKKLQDLLENWEKLEPRLNREIAAKLLTYPELNLG